MLERTFSLVFYFDTEEKVFTATESHRYHITDFQVNIKFILEKHFITPPQATLTCLAYVSMQCRSIHNIRIFLMTKATGKNLEALLKLIPQFSIILMSLYKSAADCKQDRYKIQLRNYHCKFFLKASTDNKALLCYYVYELLYVLTVRNNYTAESRQLQLPECFLI